jgi:hypothetical protein
MLHAARTCDEGLGAARQLDRPIKRQRAQGMREQPHPPNWWVLYQTDQVHTVIHYAILTNLHFRRVTTGKSCPKPFTSWAAGPKSRGAG